VTHGNYQKYTNPNPLQQHLIRTFLHTVTTLVQEVRPNRVLDVGCAEGFVAAHMRPALAGTRFIGVDRDAAALDRARRLHPWFPTCVGDILSLPVPNEAVDLVLCTEVLEHIPQPERALEELLRVSHAYLLLSVPWEPWFRVANVLRLKNLPRWGDDPEHVNHWTRTGFRRFLTAYGQIRAHRLAFPWQIVLLEKRS